MKIPPDGVAVEAVGQVDRPRVGTEDHQQAVHDHGGEPDQQNELLVFGPADEGLISGRCSR